MKKIILMVSLLVGCSLVNAQLLKKIKDKVDKKVDKKIDDATSGNKDEKKNTGENETAGTNTGSTKEPATIKAYSKYDFVPGEKIIVFEDFAQDAVGDFPDKWNTTSSGEIVTIDGKPEHWFMLTKNGIFMPEYIDSLPENFTIEYDLLADKPVTSWGIYTVIAELSDRNKLESFQGTNNRISINLFPGSDGNGSSSYDRRKSGTGEGAITTKTSQFKNINKPVHVALWRQNERLRVYLNEEKTWDLPKAFEKDANLNALLFWVQLTDNWHFLIGNLRLATGAPDTRNKILTQNKWVTHGILFDVNSDKIKPESYGTLKEMANVLKEFADLKVQIVGHTDADGSDAANLDLSKRRAAAVKDMLAKEFGIDESRMETDGKGESEPIDTNDTPAGKANNRRVEFIKI